MIPSQSLPPTRPPTPTKHLRELEGRAWYATPTKDHLSHFALAWRVAKSRECVLPWSLLLGSTGRQRELSRVFKNGAILSHPEMEIESLLRFFGCHFLGQITGSVSPSMDCMSQSKTRKQDHSSDLTQKKKVTLEIGSFDIEKAEKLRWWQETVTHKAGGGCRSSRCDAEVMISYLFMAEVGTGKDYILGPGAPNGMFCFFIFKKRHCGDCPVHKLLLMKA